VAYDMLKTAFPETAVSIGTGYDGRFALGIRLHNPPEQAADTLAGLDLFPAMPASASTEPPMVRYMLDGLAYVDPGQAMAVSQLKAVCQRISQACEEDPFLKDCLGHVSFQSGQLRLDVCHKENRAQKGGQLLERLFPPAYTVTSKVVGGIHEGQAYIKLDTPLGFNLAESGVLGLDFVLADPEVDYKEWEHAQSGDLWVYIQANPDDVEDLWSKASSIALTAGIHPVGTFYFSRNNRLTFNYNPPALTSR